MNNKIIIFFLIILIVVVAFVFYVLQFRGDGASLTFSSGEVMKVVVSLPLGLSTGQSMLDSMRLAFDEINYKIGPFTVELVPFDDSDPGGAWNSELELENAKKAAADPDVMAFLGPFNSGAAKVSMPVLNRAGIVQISPGNTWPGLTKVGFAPGEPGIFYPTGIRHYFRVVTTDDHQGPAGALWAQELGFKRVYIIDDGETYGKGIADLFRGKAQELGFVILGQKTIDKRSSDFRALIQEIKEFDPDLVYYGGITPNGITFFVRQMRESGFKSAVMGPDGIVERDFIDRIGAKDAEGIYATTVGVAVDQIGTNKADAYRQAYKSKYGTEPEVFGTFGYESARVLIQAIGNAGVKDRAAILKAVGETVNFNGLFDQWSFDQNGDTSLILMSGNVVKNGSFKFVKKLDVPL